MKTLYVLSKDEIESAMRKFLTLDCKVSIPVGSNLDISNECDDCEVRYQVENLTVEIYDEKEKEKKNKENEQKKEDLMPEQVIPKSEPKSKKPEQF